MRGAMLMDAESGARLEPDQDRGIRASRFDWECEASDSIDRCLAAAGLTHYRTKEALALASKVAYAPGIIAELCWSDDPDYQAGYIAARKTGYVRFPNLKRIGDPTGGRVFFIHRNDADLEAIIRFLEQEPVLISAPGDCKPPLPAEDFFKQEKHPR
jgi:6-carboxyhexanoate--CoA ligase